MIRDGNTLSAEDWEWLHRWRREDSVGDEAASGPHYLQHDSGLYLVATDRRAIIALAVESMNGKQTNALNPTHETMLRTALTLPVKGPQESLDMYTLRSFAGDPEWHAELEPAQLGCVMGVWVNRRLLARALYRLDAEEVLLNAERSYLGAGIVRVVSPGWMVGVLGFREVGTAARHTAPRLFSED